MKYYNRKMKLSGCSKIFVFNSQDDYIKRILVHWGWVENRILDSPFYHLKWTYMDANADHRTINGQILNHFKNNQELTSKGGLMKNMKNYVGFDLKVDEFLPRSYDLASPTDCDNFYLEHEKTTLMIVLKKHYQLVISKVPPSTVQSIVE